MKKLKFDLIALVVGGMFFFVYWAMFEDTFLKFPNILLTLYFLICTICFAFVLDDFERNRKKVPSILLRLIYLFLYFISPFYVLYFLIGGRYEN